MILAVTSYHGNRFQVPTRLTTVTHQTSEYRVDLTRHPKFPLAFDERSFPTLLHDFAIFLTNIYTLGHTVYRGVKIYKFK